MPLAPLAMRWLLAILLQRRGRLASAAATRRSKPGGCNGAVAIGRHIEPAGSIGSSSRRSGFPWPRPTAGWATRGLPNVSIRPRPSAAGTAGGSVPKASWPSAVCHCAHTRLSRSSNAARQAGAAVRSGAAAAAPRRPARRGGLARCQAGRAGSAEHDDAEWPASRHAGLRRQVPLPGVPNAGSRVPRPASARLSRWHTGPVHRPACRLATAAFRPRGEAAAAAARRRPFGLRPRRVSCSTSTAISPPTTIWRSIAAAGLSIDAGKTRRGTRNGSSPLGSTRKVDGGGRYRAEGVDRKAAPAGGRLGAGPPAGRARRRFSVVDHSGRRRQPYCPTGLDTWYFSRKAGKIGGGGAIP